MIKKHYFAAFIYFLCAHLLCTSNEPITLFSHGIVDNHTQINRHLQAIAGPAQSFDFEDAQAPTAWNFNNFLYQTCALFGKTVNREKMYMGQGQDIETLHAQINPLQEYILYGLSRGGAAIINYLAKYNPTNIQAIVLDSSPADVVSTIHDTQYTLGYKFAPNRPTQETIFQTIFPAYPSNSTPPVQAIAQITQKDLPIFLVHCHADGRVPIDSVWQIYLAFIKNGFHNVYLCELSYGKHGYLLQGKDKDKYLHAIHSFYKKYNLPYNPEFADIDITTLQPSTQEIEQKLNIYQENLYKKYMQRHEFLKNTTILALTGITLFAGFNYLKTYKHIEE